MTEPRQCIGVFCDDVRQEVGNKLSLMGVFGGDIQIPAKPPITLPRLGLAVWIRFAPGDAPTKLTLRIIGPPNRTLLFGAEIEDIVAPKTKAEPATTMQTALTVGPLVLREGGLLEVEVQTERETIRAAKINLVFKPELAA